MPRFPHMENEGVLYVIALWRLRVLLFSSFLLLPPSENIRLRLPQTL